MTDLVIRPIRYGAPVVQALVGEAMADLGERYGGSGDGTPVDAIEFDPPDGAFLVAYLDGVAVGCGGWRSYLDQSDGDETAEVKRMYTRPHARGHGVARAVLAAIEESARAQGRKRVILETGLKQSEAIRLYERAGYDRIENFGHYKDSPGCVSFGRSL